MAKITEQYDRSQAAILPARPDCFEIEAISASDGLGQFCPLLRWQALKYRHIPAVCRLALNKIDSNLEGADYGF